MLTLNPSLYLAQAISPGNGARLRLRHRSAWGDGPVLRVQSRMAWGRAGVAIAHRAAWDDKPVLRRAHRAGWTYLTPARASHRAGWTLHLALAVRAVWGLRLETSRRHPYGDMRRHAVSLRQPWRLTAQARAAHRAAWAITPTDPVAGRLAAAWSLLDDPRIQAVADTPELAWRGVKMGLIEATLSCDEASPVWMARLVLADLSGFAAIAIGDAITLTLGLETFRLVVDGKTLSRISAADRRMELTAVSPVALLDAPFAGTRRYHRTTAETARAAVESLLGQTVDWRLPEWIIPAGRLMMEQVTPLSAARAIVAAIGGLIESAPDGTVVCRRRHPVGIPDYAAASVDHVLSDADVISTQASIAPLRGYNRVTISNEDGAAAADRIEYLADPGDPHQGTVRAWPGRQRPVALAHTGHPATVIASLGAVSRTVSETVEFVAGQAFTRYPVAALQTLVWQHADLGAVTTSGQTLTAATSGYSLARITYTTTSLDWRVSLAASEEVQFVLMDV